RWLRLSAARRVCRGLGASRRDESAGAVASRIGCVAQVAEVHVGEVQLGLTFGVEPQPEAFVRKRLADVVEPPLVRKLPVFGNRLYFELRRVEHGFVILV